MDCLIIAVAHRQYREITLDELNKMFMPDLPMKERVLIDVKAIYPVSELKAGGFCYWRL
jgi:UDP-N-acetyl-D-galactosamine dehydrogenase